jgi:hypothetical protein
MGKSKRPVVHWTPEQVTEVVKLYKEGLTFEEISLKIGISHASTKAKITALRKSGMDIPYRDRQDIAQKRIDTIAKGGRKPSAFDREYQGAVPFGHWLITKAWPYKPDEEEDVA